MSDSTPSGARSAAAPTLPAVDRDLLARLREAFLAASYTAGGCQNLLGRPAHAALARGETVPALRATRGGGPLETLVRLFLLQQPVAGRQVRTVLPVADCLAAGWLVPDGDRLRATVDVRPHADGVTEPDGTTGPGTAAWVVSDLGCAVGGVGGIGAAGTAGDAARRDLVLGSGGASVTLAGITVRRPVREALDLGTGSGVQALAVARHAGRVTATDVNPRALHVTRLTLGLSGLLDRAEVVRGGLFEPVGDRRFGLIVSNPPFVISPEGRFTYRDGGMPGDSLCRTLVRQAGRHLEPGGYCQLLANWQHVRGEDWRERLAGWVAGTGCDAWVVQREVQDVAQYAELWLRDAGDHRGGAGPDGPQPPGHARGLYLARYDRWLDHFERAGVEGVGFGWITLRAAGADRPTVRVEDWPHPVEQPLGADIERWFARQDFLRGHDDAALLATRFRVAGDVVQEQLGPPGAEDPAHVVLRRQRGMRRATAVDTAGAGLVGACDGNLTAGVIVDAIARLLGEDGAALRERMPEPVRLLVEQGFIEPVDGPRGAGAGPS